MLVYPRDIPLGYLAITTCSIITHFIDCPKAYAWSEFEVQNQMSGTLRGKGFSLSSPKQNIELPLIKERVSQVDKGGCNKLGNKFATAPLIESKCFNRTLFK